MYYFGLLTYMSSNEYAQEKLCSYDAKNNGLMESTGLKDKNGKEIYENDIVEAVWYNHDEPENKTIGKVIFNKGWLSFCIWNESEGTMSEMNGQGYYTWEIKVIGNFYENPELYELIMY